MQAIKMVLERDRPAGGRGKENLRGVKGGRHGGRVAVCGWAGTGKGRGWEAVSMAEEGDQRGGNQREQGDWKRPDRG